MTKSSPQGRITNLLAPIFQVNLKVSGKCALFLIKSSALSSPKNSGNSVFSNNPKISASVILSTPFKTFL